MIRWVLFWVLWGLLSGEKFTIKYCFAYTHFSPGTSRRLVSPVQFISKSCELQRKRKQRKEKQEKLSKPTNPKVLFFIISFCIKVQVNVAVQPHSEIAYESRSRLEFGRACLRSDERTPYTSYAASFLTAVLQFNNQVMI